MLPGNLSAIFPGFIMYWAPLSHIFQPSSATVPHSAGGMDIFHALGELEENELYLINVDLPTTLNLVLPSLGDMKQWPSLEASIWFKILSPGSGYI